ncbi:MAG: glutathione synthase/RimK-type ligase-like ATP-grasp enzyme [Lysobacterales bacterium]|jgi:glutathione synthase/RimK-type ligase-like ATP-grasp enzyme
MAILFMIGLNDKNSAIVMPGKNGKPSFSVDGSSNISGKIKFKPKFKYLSFLYGNKAPQPKLKIPPNINLAFNEISDPDSHQGALRRCSRLCRMINVPIINHPNKIIHTTRDSVSAILQGIPLTFMPKTIRCTPRTPNDIFSSAEKGGIEFPYIVRLAGHHGGVSMTLIEKPEDLNLLHVYPFDGSDFYLTQYIDFKDDSGLYHKLRIIVIDGEPILRHAFFDQKWNVHGPSKTFMLKQEHWDEYLQRTRLLEEQILKTYMPVIKEISKRIKLEYFGIDCSIRPDGTMLIFEVNANMNVLDNRYEQLEELIERIKKSIGKMLTKYSEIGIKRRQEM